VSTHHIAPSLRLLVLNSPQAYHHFFFSTCCACDVCDRPGLPSPWLCSHGNYSPTAPSLCSLWPLVPNSSLTRCESVQVYHHHPWSRVLLDPVYHIIYLWDYLMWALPGWLELGQFPLCAGWTTEPHFVTLMVARAVGRFSSGHWPASDIGHNCGWSTKFIAWSIVRRSLFEREGQTAGCRESRVLIQILG
jgi:hypothetical protein